ncbi:MAG: SDR family NAD(P)-dependent oxidoreductase [Congregibacter sp.]
MRALVTGASAGIGEAYVQQLAERCDSMLLVARREDRLQALIERLPGKCHFELLIADLATQEGQARTVEAIRQGAALDLLINNAGFSTLGPFVDCDLDKEIVMLRLHQEATLALSRAALPAMCERGSGAVINVSSIGGLVEMPGVAVYGATKAFLVSFSRSLREELRGSGVRVQCLCPGYTRTEIHSRESFQGFDVDRVPEGLWMESDDVVAESLDAVLDTTQDRWLVVPGEHNRSIVDRSQQSLSSW